MSSQDLLSWNLNLTLMVMAESAVVVAVPARLASSRLPGKVMADIGGKPMLRHVLERCRQAKTVGSVVACSDSEEVLEAACNWGFTVLATTEACSSGSERLASVIDQLVAIGGAAADRTLVINVQGDQPLLDPQIIEAMVVRAGDPKRYWVPVITPVYKLAEEKVHNPNVVKVLRANDGRAITFSRSAIPHVRGLPHETWASHVTFWGHVGIYGYRADVLASWSELSHSPLEELESLEQLRLIEAGIPIATFAVDDDCFSVDTPEQLEKAQVLMRHHG
jgi:3-deoxy-manno-octulosonate cytidylyltransferase (CMP-KDO synthetase)